jgi:hypothetical protein
MIFYPIYRQRKISANSSFPAIGVFEQGLGDVDPAERRYEVPDIYPEQETLGRIQYSGPVFPSDPPYFSQNRP